MRDDNNPGRLPADGVRWRGLVERTRPWDDRERFARFVTPHDGLRAFALKVVCLLRGQGALTLQMLASYVAPEITPDALADVCGLNPYIPLDPAQDLVSVVRGIADQRGYVYPVEAIEEAVMAALAVPSTHALHPIRTLEVVA